MSLVLYKFDASAPSRAVLMLVDILGLELQTKDVNTITGEHMEEDFLKINHLHTVPVLIDEGLTLTDSHVIMTYLVEKYGANSQLYPKDLKTRSLIDQLMYLESTILTPKIIAVVMSICKGQSAPTEEQVASIEQAYGFIDKYLEKTQFLVGDHLTLADISCVSPLASLNSLVPFDDRYKNLKKWFNLLKKESWFQKINATGVDKFKAYMKQKYGFGGQ